jgi:hypothetical protein
MIQPVLPVRPSTPRDRTLITACLLAIILTVAARANAQDVTGRWAATFDAAVTRDGAALKVDRRAPAILQLVRRGDSVSGTWEVEGDPPRHVRGTFDGTRLLLSSDVRDTEIRVNGKPVTMKAMTKWTAVLTGEKLAGTMLVYLGDREPPPRKWEAHR